MGLGESALLSLFAACLNCLCPLLPGLMFVAGAIWMRRRQNIPALPLALAGAGLGITLVAPLLLVMFGMQTELLDAAIPDSGAAAMIFALPMTLLLMNTADIILFVGVGIGMVVSAIAIGLGIRTKQWGPVFISIGSILIGVMCAVAMIIWLLYLQQSNESFIPLTRFIN
jgi:hypothetical protein